MTISLQALLRADLAAVRGVAEQWMRLGLRIDRAVEDLTLRTSDLEDHWFSGEAAQAARDKGVHLRVRLGNAHDNCVATGVAAREFADDLDQCRRLLDQLVAEARGHGLQIDLASGEITVPLALAGSVTQTTVTQATIDAYAQQISQVLTRADEADQRAAAILGRNSYREDFGPDDKLPDYPKIDGPSLAAWTPRNRAEWWLGLHPMIQDRLITEQPDIIATATGLPTRDRETAARLLRTRAEQSLLASRAQDESLRGDTGSRARTEREQQLSALDR
ncbi:hypothetical protein [Paractinoplanes atraurantiacus]|uniref:Uncharacterized protein n=1 Tax=Paractinoplanes atraurantiacus TaxID=1036182 RepID=A0A285K2Q1_9ACTN|nr:hypothetical protein [Actinoplanes atraurantiacus]SNY65621.1 hypothetical protein SAMN05421748_12889 [Actinoplanes atraurantiacus]